MILWNHPGDITIVYTSKEYQPRSDVFDESYKFVGPSIATRKEVRRFPMEDLKDKKLIFISMGKRRTKNAKAFHDKCENHKDT